MKKILLLLIISILLITPINKQESTEYQEFIAVELGTINLNQTKMTLGINYSSNLKTTTSSNLSSSKITYSSSDPNIATVDSTGKVTGKGIGTAYITASIGSNKATCVITVIKDFIPVTKITLNKTNITLTTGNTETIESTLSPTDASNKSIIYSSSNEDIAIVDNFGKITAKSIGTTYITVTSGENKATCVVNVVDTIALTSITTKSSITIKEKENASLIITYTPTNATNKKVTWKSSNNNVATVDANGLVTGVSPGTATITAISNDGGHVTTCKVIIEAISKKLNSISLNKTELTLVSGKEEALTIKYDPEYAENKNVTWSSSDEKIATVENGKITAIKPGVAEIKAVSEDGNKEAICKLTVTSPDVETISFKNEKETVYLNSKKTLTPILTPENSALENAIWTSENELIATVENGTVTAKSLGTTTITVSTEDEKITASIEITVTEKPADPLLIEISGYNLNFDPKIKNYKLTIGNETKLNITTNIDSQKVTIKGNQDLKNGSIITITIKDKETTTYVINIAKKENYTVYFIGAISILLSINIIRILIKNKKSKKD